MSSNSDGLPLADCCRVFSSYPRCPACGHTKPDPASTTAEHVAPRELTTVVHPTSPNPPAELSLPPYLRGVIVHPEHHATPSRWKGAKGSGGREVPTAKQTYASQAKKMNEPTSSSQTASVALRKSEQDEKAEKAAPTGQRARVPPVVDTASSTPSPHRVRDLSPEMVAMVERLKKISMTGHVPMQAPGHSVAPSQPSKQALQGSLTISDVQSRRTNVQSPPSSSAWATSCKTLQQKEGEWSEKLPDTYEKVNSRRLRHLSHMQRKNGGSSQAVHHGVDSRTALAPKERSAEDVIDGLTRPPLPRAHHVNRPQTGIPGNFDGYPSQEYVNWIWEYLTPTERETVERLFKEFADYEVSASDFEWEKRLKSEERIERIQSAVKIFYSHEAEAARFAVNFVQKVRAGTPRTDRGGLIRQRFRLGPPFKPKPTLGFPDVIDASRRLAMTSRPTLGENAGKSVEAEGKAKASDVPMRSLEYHIQDYPLLNNQYVKHLGDWCDEIRKSCSTSEGGNVSQWDVYLGWMVAELRRAAKDIMPAELPVQERESAHEALTAYIERNIYLIGGMIGSLRTQANVFRDWIQDETATPSVAIGKKRFDSAIQAVRLIFDEYNQGIDKSIESLQNDESATDVLFEATSAAGKKFGAFCELMGDLLPAESDVRAVIPRLAWPNEVYFEDDLDEGSSDWANQEVPGHSTGFGKS